MIKNREQDHNNIYIGSIETIERDFLKLFEINNCIIISYMFK